MLKSIVNQDEKVNYTVLALTIVEEHLKLITRNRIVIVMYILIK